MRLTPRDSVVTMCSQTRGVAWCYLRWPGAHMDHVTSSDTFSRDFGENLDVQLCSSDTGVHWTGVIGICVKLFRTDQ